MWEMPEWLLLVRELQLQGLHILEAIIVANLHFNDDGTRKAETELQAAIIFA